MVFVAPPVVINRLVVGGTLGQLFCNSCYLQIGICTFARDLPEKKALHRIGTLHCLPHGKPSEWMAFALALVWRSRPVIHAIQ